MKVARKLKRFSHFRRSRQASSLRLEGRHERWSACSGRSVFSQARKEQLCYTEDPKWRNSIPSLARNHLVMRFLSGSAALYNHLFLHP
jgi:hypothetical protein